MDARRLTGMRFFRGGRCTACNGTGYRRRVGVFEVLEVDPTIQRLIAAGRSDREIAAAGQTNHMRTLRNAALAHVRAGTSTLADAIKETA